MTYRSMNSAQERNFNQIKILVLGETNCQNSEFSSLFWAAESDSQVLQNENGATKGTAR